MHERGGYAGSPRESVDLSVTRSTSATSGICQDTGAVDEQIEVS
jgi:hypothetical protein